MPNIISNDPLVEFTKRKYYDYRGIINVQTVRSTGSGTLDTIAEAANQASLDFVIITDVNDFIQQREQDGYRQRTLLISGGKYSYLDSRLINFDWNSPDPLQGPGRSQTFFAEILSQKKSRRLEGLFVLSHPLKPGYELAKYPPGLDGIELFNLKSIWQWTWNHSRTSFFWTLFLYPFNSDLAFIRILPDSTEAEFNLWDRLLKEQMVYGYAGADADAKFRILEDSFIVFPSYKDLFSIVRTHVWMRSELTGDAAEDRKKILTSLRNGEFYIGTDILGDTTGFSNYLATPDGKDILPGHEIKFQKDLQFIVSLDRKPLADFEITIFKDGEKLLSSDSQITNFQIQSPGVYRATVRAKVLLPLPEGRKWMTWITSNPFFIRP